jgi:beta-lactamase regulating signal transducer with metallopeptidase domain
LWSLARVWREQRVLQRLPRLPIDGTALAGLEGEADGVPIEIIPAATANAFCAGIVRPRVLVTRGLLLRLDEEELRAAVRHELEHARALGPLKVALAHVAARALFWLPALGDLLERYILLSELSADRAAIRATSRSALAGALAEVIDAPPRPAGAVALADFAAPRIDRLLDPAAELPPIFRRSSLVAALIAVAAVVFVFVCSPHLGLGESEQLHSMSVNLLAHHAGARLLGLCETAAVVATGLAIRRKFASRR